MSLPAAPEQPGAVPRLRDHVAERDLDMFAGLLADLLITVARRERERAQQQPALPPSSGKGATDETGC